jgi:hypothetical protein
MEDVMDEKTIREPEDIRRLQGLPDHERDPNESVGGGLMSQGGTAHDRGTGTLGGVAEGPNAGAPEDENLNEDDPDAGAAGGARPRHLNPDA